MLLSAVGMERAMMVTTEMARVCVMLSLKEALVKNASVGTTVATAQASVQEVGECVVDMGPATKGYQERASALA